MIKDKTVSYKLGIVKLMFEEMFEGQFKNLNLNLKDNMSELSIESMDMSLNLKE